MKHLYKPVVAVESAFEQLPQQLVKLEAAAEVVEDAAEQVTDAVAVGATLISCQKENTYRDFSEIKMHIT